MSEAADEALELDCDHATPTLKEIVCATPPTPAYAKYHDMYLTRCGAARAWVELCATVVCKQQQQ